LAISGNLIWVSLLKNGRRATDTPNMYTKLLILLAWASYFALQQTADNFWRFLLMYCSVLAICSLFYRRESKPTKSKKK
jgi:hypothetical protein